MPRRSLPRGHVIALKPIKVLSLRWCPLLAFYGIPGTGAASCRLPAHPRRIREKRKRLHPVGGVRPPALPSSTRHFLGSALPCSRGTLWVGDPSASPVSVILARRLVAVSFGCSGFRCPPAGVERGSGPRGHSPPWLRCREPAAEPWRWVGGGCCSLEPGVPGRRGR